MASIFKRGGARGGGRSWLFNSFGLIIVACTGCDPEATAPEPPTRAGDTGKVTTGPAPVKVPDDTLFADTFTNRQTGEVLKGTLMGTVAIAGQEDYLVKLESGQRRRLPVSVWEVKANPKPKPANRVGIAAPLPPPPWDGFRGIAWGTHLKDTKGMELLREGSKGMELLRTSGDWTYYKRANDRLAIGKARLSQIVYGFYKYRFADVNIDCAGVADFAALKRAVFATYGEGEKCGDENSPFHVVWWCWGGPEPGHKGVSDVIMCLDRDLPPGKGGLTLQYPRLTSP